MKKLLLYSLTLVGMLVSSTQFAFAQLATPTYKEIKSSTGSFFLKTSQAVLGEAYTDNWAADGRATGTFSPGGDKSGAYNPETGENNFAIKKTASVSVKQKGSNKEVYLYVKGITGLKVYFFNGSTSGARGATVDIKDNTNNIDKKTKEVSVGASSQITDMDLNASNEYTININGGGADVILYGIHFYCPVSDVVEAPRIDSDGLGNVTISHAAGTTVKYTTDGTEPTATLGTDYNDATGIVLTEDATVKAVAIRTEDSQLSEVTTLNVSVLKTIGGMQICNFNEGKVSNTDYFLGTISSTSVDFTLDGVNYTKAWKVQSADNLIFKTQNNALLKLVLAKRTDKSTYNYKIKVDEEGLTLSKEGVIYKEIAAGTHTLSQNGSESAVAYIGVFENYSTISNEISTMYYEYPVSLADGLTAYTGTVNGNSVSLTAIQGNVVKANTPVIVKATAAGTYYINESNEVGAGDAGSLRGTPTALTVGSNTYYTLGHKDGDPSAEIGFYKFTGAEIPANKAYIDGATVSGAPKFLSIEGDGNTTGIHDTMIDNADVDAPMFNIAGQRVGNNAKGLVIKNGKKYMLK